MGLIQGILGTVFGSGHNVVRDTVEVFRENAEAGAGRDANLRQAAMGQFAAEFSQPRAGWFDRMMDGVNRVPRPALALGTLALFAAAMTDPVWFSSRMQGLALVPEPLWWLLGAVVSFYFGARHHQKTQAFQRELAATLARTPSVVDNIGALQSLSAGSPGAADPGPDADTVRDAVRPEVNAALEEWRARHSA
jgi:hypothetical protein